MPLHKRLPTRTRNTDHQMDTLELTSPTDQLANKPGSKHKRIIYDSSPIPNSFDNSKSMDVVTNGCKRIKIGAINESTPENKRSLQDIKVDVSFSQKTKRQKITWPWLGFQDTLNSTQIIFALTTFSIQFVSIRHHNNTYVTYSNVCFNNDKAFGTNGIENDGRVQKLFIIFSKLEKCFNSERLFVFENIVDYVFVLLSCSNIFLTSHNNNFQTIT